MKKIPQTDAIFENVFRENQASDENPKSLRVSIDTKAKVSRAINLRIRLIYYPPYHSKYNPIERCWAALENYWNGAILDSVEATIQWAANMSWKGIAPIVHLVETTYEKGIKVLPQDLEQYQTEWQRSETLPQWDITIVPV